MWMDQRPQVAMLGGLAMLYLAGREAVAAVAGAGAAPGRRAIACWLPIAAATGVAIGLGQSDASLSIIFASSVAALGLAGGTMVMLPWPLGDPAPVAARRAWPLLMPTVLLALLVGFAGIIRLRHVAILLIEGGAILGVWLRDRDGPEETGYSAPATTKPVRLMAAVALSVAGAFLAIKAAMEFSQSVALINPAMVVATLLGPLLALPILADGAELRGRGIGWAATTTQVGVVQLNLCLLLPATVLIWRWKTGSAMVFPLSDWRVGAVALVLLAAALLPEATGRWRLGRLEGALMLLVYVAYLIAAAAAAAW
jgi:hypothetical protein